MKATTSDHLAAGDELVDLVSRGVINAPEVTVASQDLADAGNRAVASGFRLYDESSPTLGAILKERISGARSSIFFGVLCSVGGVLLTLLIGVQVIRGMTDQVGAITGPIGHQWWRVASTIFAFNNGGTEFVTLVAIAIFGLHIERRFGPIAAGAIFLASGAAGAALSVAVSSYPALGANGAALGLLAAWIVDDRLAHARGDERGNDMLGAYVIGGLLLLLPVGDTDTSFFAGLGGAAVGAAAGAALSPLRP